MTPTSDPALAAPEVIYLQDGGDYASAHEVTWCQHSVDDADTAYIRLDLHESAVQAAVAKAVEAAAAINDHLAAFRKKQIEDDEAKHWQDRDAIMRRCWKMSQSGHEAAAAAIRARKGDAL